MLLARNRQPPPTVAAGVPHAELAAALITLPSGLLAMVCEAIVKLKVRLGAAWACVEGGLYALFLWECVCVKEDKVVAVLASRAGSPVIPKLLLLLCP